MIFFSFPASLLAFDQYGQLSDQLETESALRERAESVATQVREKPLHWHNTLHVYFLKC